MRDINFNNILIEDVICMHLVENGLKSNKAVASTLDVVVNAYGPNEGINQVVKSLQSDNDAKSKDELEVEAVVKGVIEDAEVDVIQHAILRKYADVTLAIKVLWLKVCNLVVEYENMSNDCKEDLSAMT
ncbi:hypothetical protein A0H81_02807 [Grifola frondosa]|uniref:Uncharacterized protein n=1 Tax=Grifola frondosa TaxID=5627 RepID=A0A1C7MNT6_GRIFR|nr:hypothetical protein A0H81_10978 [Grifola frondosa]OBZ78478.1 hypothetical protein A0H81_02807 [Grifola frondosa]